jgi:hypothetical protein
MRKSINSKAVFGSEYGREYFCDQCHIYLGVQELIDNWNYDAADLFDTESDKRIFSAGRCSTNKVPYPIVFDKTFYETLEIRKVVPVEENLIFNKDEPMWWTNKERQDAYEMVDRMFTGVPEWEEGTTNEGIDIGIEGWPI